MLYTFFVSGITSYEVITVEDRELIKELVAIAVGERLPQRYSSTDKRGQIINTFVKEYFNKLYSKSHQCAENRSNGVYKHDYTVNEKIIPKSLQMKYPEQFGEVLDSGKEGGDTRKPDDRPDVIPRGSPYKENRRLSRYEVESEIKGDVRIPGLNLDFDELGCKYMEGGSTTCSEGSPKSDDDEWLKLKFEEKLNVLLKDLPMNKKNGNFFVDRKLGE